MQPILPAMQKPIARFICVICVNTVGLSTQLNAAKLEEIIVTAQKKEQNIQNVPIAITAFSKDSLVEMGVNSVEGISKAVPNLNLTSSVGYSVNSVINVRGSIQTSNNLSRDASVGVYLDGVPITKTTGSIFDVVDLERVEVLRGPQGTLYGRNSVGGALNLVTSKPQDEFGGSLRVGIGNENLKTVRVGVDLGSVGEADESVGKISSKVSYVRKKRDGFYDMEGVGGDGFDNLDQTGGRFALRWDYSDRFYAQYSYDIFEMRQNPPMLATVTGEGASDNDRPNGIVNDASRRSFLDVDGHALELNFDIGETRLGDLAIKTISARRTFDNDSRTDFDGSGDDLFRFVSVNDFEQRSHEIQLLGRSDNVDWVFGLFYFEDEWFTDNPRWIFQFGGDTFDIDERGADEKAIAAFAQASWSPDVFNDQVEITGGIRYTEEEKDVKRRRISAGSFASPTAGPCDLGSGAYLRNAEGCPILNDQGEVQAISADDDWSAVTPMLSATWNIDSDKHVYAKIVSGFRSGGFNGVANTNATFEQNFDPEEMVSYELGFKSRWLDDALQLNGAYFFNDLKDIQVEAFDPVLLGVAIGNAGKAELQGVELEISAIPVESLELQLNAAWLDTKYTQYVEGGIDVADERVVPYSPEYSFNTMVRYSHPTEYGEFQARVDYSWKDDHSVTATASPGIDIEAYGLWDARLSIADIPVNGDGDLRLSLWGKNLSDEEYWDVALNLQVFSVAQWANPRSYGFDIEYNF